MATPMFCGANGSSPGPGLPVGCTMAVCPSSSAKNRKAVGDAADTGAPDRPRWSWPDLPRTSACAQVRGVTAECSIALRNGCGSGVRLQLPRVRPRPSARSAPKPAAAMASSAAYGSPSGMFSLVKTKRDDARLKAAIVLSLLYYPTFGLRRAVRASSSSRLRGWSVLTEGYDPG